MSTFFTQKNYTKYHVCIKNLIQQFLNKYCLCMDFSDFYVYRFNLMNDKLAHSFSQNVKKWFTYNYIRK